MPGLSLSFLGSYSACVDGQVLTDFNTDKVRALLTYLVIESNVSHRRSALAGLLWPDYPEEAARASLRNALYNLRHTIHDDRSEPPFLFVTPTTLQFNSQSNVWVDVIAFKSKLAQASRIDLAAQATERAQILKDAIGLYQGEFLQGFSLRDCPEFEQWQLDKKTYYERQMVEAFKQLVALYEGDEDYLQAIDYSQRLVTLAPWEEEAHQHLIRLYARTGQRSLALRQFEACRRILSLELGVEPTQQTIALYETITADSIKAQVDENTPVNNLPVLLSPLIGREADLLEIEHQLNNPDCRLITVSGPGGVGKTCLAIESAWRQASHFTHGVIYISLAAVPNLDSVVIELTQILNISFLQVSNRRRLLLDYLTQRELLILFDNCEHLPSASDLIIEILHNTRGIKILATSRSRLNLSGEVVLILAGLEYPTLQEVDAGRIKSYGAIQLLIQGVQRSITTSQPAEAELLAMVKICHLVNGIPLALLQAASWCSMMSLIEIEANIHQRGVEFLQTDWLDVPEQQRSMQAVFDHSFTLLSPHEKQVFISLGIFQGSFSGEAAQAIAQADRFVLRGLVNKTMLQPDQNGRFQYHDLLRQYAQSKLHGNPVLMKSLSERFAQYFVVEMVELFQNIQGPQQIEAMQAIFPDWPNLTFAWNWAIENRKFGYLTAALDGYCTIFQWFSRYEEGRNECRHTIQTLFTPLPTAADGEQLNLLIRLIAWAVYFSNWVDPSKQTRAELEWALIALVKLDQAQTDNIYTRAFLLQQAGEYLIISNFKRGWDYWLQSLALYRELGFKWRMAQVLENLAVAASPFIHDQEVTDWLAESLAIRRSLGDQVGTIHTLFDLALLKAASDDADLFTAYALESSETNRLLENTFIWADGLLLQAVRRTYHGKFKQAQIVFREVLRRYRQNGTRDQIISTLGLLGWIEANLGLYEQALIDTQAAVDLARQTTFVRLQAMCLWGVAEIWIAQGKVEQPVPILEECIRLYRSTEPIDEMGMALCDLAALEAETDQWAASKQHFSEGFTIILESTTWQGKVYALANLARIYTVRGEVEKAIEYYALATRYPYLGNSVYWWDVAGKRLHERASSLSEKIIQAAKLRGTNRDLDQTCVEITATL